MTQKIKEKSQRVVTALTCADTNGLFDSSDKNFAIANFSGTGGTNNGLNHAINRFIGDDHLNSNFGEKIHHVLSASIKLSMTFLTPETLDLRDG
jgi:hypothetical protein